MLLNEELFDSILEKAEASERGRMNYDLRTQAFESGKDAVPEKSGLCGSSKNQTNRSGVGWKDSSQRMLNVLTPRTVIPIHRHNETSETVIVLRGAVEEVFFDSSGNVTESHILSYGGPCPGIQVPRGVYHTCRCLEPGSVIFEAKDRPYDPAQTEDFL